MNRDQELLQKLENELTEKFAGGHCFVARVRAVDAAKLQQRINRLGGAYLLLNYGLGRQRTLVCIVGREYWDKFSPAFGQQEYRSLNLAVLLGELRTYADRHGFGTISFSRAWRKSLGVGNRRRELAHL